MLTFVLIGCCDYFDFGFTTIKKYSGRKLFWTYDYDNLKGALYTEYMIICLEVAEGRNNYSSRNI